MLILHVRSLVRRNEPILLILLLLALAGFGTAYPSFLSQGTLFAIAQQTAVIAIVAFAMTAVIIARGIDISVGSTLALSGIVAALVFGQTGSSAATVVAAILVGATAGLLNGGLIGFVGISPFIATLATMAFARGAALSLSGSSSIPLADPLLLWAGNGTVLGMPAALLLALVCFFGWWVLLHRTVLGRGIYAVGGNRTAARASLLPVRRIEVLVYVLAGAASGIGAIITLGRLSSAQPLAGSGLEFAAITAVIIGGTKLSGGEGSLTGTAIGAALLGVVDAGLSFMRIPQQFIYYFTGGLVLGAVLLSQPEAVRMSLSYLRQRRGRGSLPRTAAEASGNSLNLVGLGKRFPGVKALDNVSFSIAAGDVLGLVGENGAGKSTLVKCISGIYRPDEGSMLLNGKEMGGKSPDEIRGISVMHQHFSLVPDLTVLQNLFLGREKRTFLGLLDRRRMEQEARRIIGELGFSINPHAGLSALTIGQRQMVEIARAMLADAWLFVMDEPTSALTTKERDQLYDVIERIRKRGGAVIYISHRMDEIFNLTSRIVVLRDGKFIGERPTSSTDEREIISMMVGREITNVFPYVAVSPGAVVLSVENLSDGGLLREVSLQVRAGEIVAISGLMGSGRSEVLRCIAGLVPVTSGVIRVADQLLTSGNAKGASAAGVAMVPEDRHLEGFVGALSIRDNLALVWMRAHSWLGFIRPSQLARLAENLIASLGVRPAQINKKVRELSGGNQQKVVIGKWLATQPRLLLLDEPTNGIDVAAKTDLHMLIAGLKRSGAAILMVSSELPEVLGVADRILVMCRGRIVAECARGATEREITELAFGRSAAPSRQNSCELPPVYIGQKGGAFMVRALSNGALAYLPLVLLMVLTLGFGLIDKRLLSVPNLVNVLGQAAPIALLALAAFVVLITAGVDLSAGVAVALCSILMGSQLDAGVGLPLALAVGLASMVALGLFNGFVIAVLRIPPFVATLATMVAVQGATLTFAQKGVLIINVPLLKSLGVARTLGIPNSIAVTAMVAIATAFLMRRTRFGLHSYAIGSDRGAAELAGIRIRRQTILVYMTSGIFVFFTAVLTVSRVPIVTPNIGGTSLLLDAISAAVIGGTSVLGGRGTVMGVLAGAVIVSLLTNVLRIFGVDPSSIDLYKGLIIIGALIGDRGISVAAVSGGRRG